jgi:hypothetical protein
MSSMRTACALALAALVAAFGAAPAGEPARSPLAEQLRRGGLVLVLRHAATDFSRGDQDPVDLKDCRTQRNLSAAGRRDAAWRRQIRAARRLFGTKPPAGRLTVLVTHGSVVGDVSGQTLEEGETLVFRPLGDSRFRLLGRILPRGWARL